MKPLPTPPSHDRTDPAAIKSAATVAKRRNNALRKKVPLFADQLHQITVEDIFVQRENARQSTAILMGRLQVLEDQTIAEQQEFIRAQVSDAEYAEIEQRAAVSRIPRRAYWSIIKVRIERRNDPMTEEADLVLAWLQTWDGPPPTPYELHQKCGDGLTPQQIRTALDWLMARELIFPRVGRPCTVSGIPFVGTYACEPNPPFE